MNRRSAFMAIALLGVIGATATGCGSMKLEEFSGTTPELKLEEYFAGQSKAWGVFEDRFGKVRRQFTVDIVGEWDGETLILTEDFVYNDGETERRVWTIRKTGDKTYVGTADGVIGEARGAVEGQALNWAYDFDLKIGESTTRVRFDDWMWLQPDGVLMNRAIVTKFGLEIGRATIFFQRLPATAVQPAFATAAE